MSENETLNGCSIHSGHSERITPVCQKVRNGHRIIYLTYAFAIGFAFCIFFIPLTEQVSRFGALLILIPTAVTGWHVFSINSSINTLNNSIAQVRSGMMCADCRSLDKDMQSANEALGSQLRLVIVCETILASIGTSIWAFGDCLSLSCLAA